MDPLSNDSRKQRTLSGIRSAEEGKKTTRTSALRTTSQSPSSIGLEKAAALEATYDVAAFFETGSLRGPNPTFSRGERTRKGTLDMECQESVIWPRVEIGGGHDSLEIEWASSTLLVSDSLRLRFPSPIRNERDEAHDLMGQSSSTRDEEYF